MVKLNPFKKELEKKEAKQEIVKEVVSRKKAPKKSKGKAEPWVVLKIPHVSEKATNLINNRQYVFEIWPRANKTEVKKAVESVYDTDVVSVKIVKTPPKKRRLGRIEGIVSGRKKAIVKLKEGQSIEVLPR